MKSTSGNAVDPERANRRLIFASALSLALVLVSSLAATDAVAGAAIAADGFAQPFAGTPKYQRFAPTETVRASQINRPLGAIATVAEQSRTSHRADDSAVAGAVASCLPRVHAKAIVGRVAQFQR